MAEDGPFEALRATEEQTAEQITKQTQGAMENYFGWLQKSMSALPWTNTNLDRILLGYATYLCVRAKTQPSEKFPRRR
jgi:hypothetical protein